MSYQPAPDLQQIVAFLADQMGFKVDNVTALGAGQWSRAYSFDISDKALVLRLGHQPNDFAKDRIAASWQQPRVPVPTFVAMGEAFDGFFAITERSTGTFLDQLTKQQAVAVLPSLFSTLDALQRVAPPSSAGFGLWDSTGNAPHDSWPAALLDIANEKPRKAGWRAALRQWPECQRVFDAAFDRLQHLVVDMPSTPGHVIHGDLVNRNVLVQHDQITSVFDWGSSMYGDYLYDIAWLTFCATPWTVGFDEATFRFHARRRAIDSGLDAEDFDRRLQCYEVHIRLDALAAAAFRDDRPTAQLVAD